MADQDYKINIETSKSGEGAEKTKAAIDNVAESTDKLNASNNPLLAGLDEHRAKQEALADATNKAAESLEKETEAVEKVTAAEKKRSELPPPGEAKAKINQVDDRTGSEKLIDQYTNSGNKVDQLRGKVLKLGTSFKKTNPKIFKFGKMLGRGGIVYSGIKLVGNGVAGLSDKIASHGEKMKSFGDDMELTGSKGAGLVQWLGKAGQSFEGVGDKIRIGINPIESYIDSTRELAEALRELDRVEKEVTAKLKQHLREREKAYEKAAIAAHERATADARKEDDEYLDEFGREENRQLDNQEKLTRAKLNRDKADVISQKEQKLTTIDRDDPEASQKRYAIEIAAEKELEAIRRNEFRQLRKIQEERVKIAETQKGTIARRAKDSSQNNTATNGDTLVTDEELARMIEDRKSFVAEYGNQTGAFDNDDDLETYESLIAAVKAQQEIRKKLKEQGIASTDEALELEKNYQKAAEEIGKSIENAKNDLNVSGINEQTRRSQQSSSAGNRVIEKKQDQNQRAKKDNATREKAQSQIDNNVTQVAEKAIGVAGGIGNQPEVNRLTNVLESFRDGASKEEVLLLRKIIGSMESFVDNQQQQKAELTSELSKQASKLDSLETQLRNKK